MKSKNELNFLLLPKRDTSNPAPVTLSPHVYTHTFETYFFLCILVSHLHKSGVLAQGKQESFSWRPSVEEI